MYVPEALHDKSTSIQAIFNPRLDTQSPRRLRFPGSCSSQPDSSAHLGKRSEKDPKSVWASGLRNYIFQHLVSLWTWDPSQSCTSPSQKITMYAYSLAHHVFLAFRVVTWMCYRVNAHHLCGLQSRLNGNWGRPVQHHAFMILYISNFRPLDKYLAYAVGSFWNVTVSCAKIWMLGQGERARPFSKGCYNWEITSWKSIAIVYGMYWMVPRGCPRGSGFSPAQLEMWPLKSGLWVMPSLGFSMRSLSQEGIFYMISDHLLYSTSCLKSPFLASKELNFHLKWRGFNVCLCFAVSETLSTYLVFWWLQTKNLGGSAQAVTN